MPASYPNEAVEHCKRLYLKYSGQSHDRIQSEMRRAGWPNWSKQNLYSRGDKVGWIEKYGWEKALKIHLDAQAERSRTSSEQALHEIEKIRQALYAEIEGANFRAGRDLVYQHLAYTKQYFTALAALKGEARSFDDFVAMWERLLDWLPDLSPKAVAELLKVSEQVLERAVAEYGGKDEERDGRED